MMVGDAESWMRRWVPAGVPTLPGASTRARAGVLVGSTYGVLAVAFWWHLISNGIDVVVHRSGDAYLNLNLFAWVPHALAHGHNPFFSTALNHPAGLNLLVNTGEPALAVALWPIAALFGPTASYNLAVILAMPLAAVTAYVLARHLVAWRPAAFFVGLVVGFGPYEVQTSLGSHLQLSFTAVVPLLFLVCMWLARGQVGPVVGGCELAALAVVQYFISTEVLMTAGLVAVIAGATALLASARVRSSLKGMLGGAIVAGALGSVVLAWPVWFTLRGPQSVKGPVQLVAQAYRSDLLALVIPPRGLALAPASLTSLSAHFSQINHENVAYLGIPLVVAGVATMAWCWRRSSVVVAAVVALTTFVLGLGGSLAISGAPAIGAGDTAVGRLWLPEALLGDLPTVKNLIPSRFALYTAIFLALLVALGLDRLRRELPGIDLPVVLPVGVMGLCVAPLIPLGASGYVLTPVGPAPAYLASSGVVPGTAIAIAPYPAGQRPVAMLWQVDTGFRFAMPSGHAKAPDGPSGAVAFTPGLGYSVSSTAALTLMAITRGQVLLEPAATSRSMRAELESWRVERVVVVTSKVAHPGRGVAQLDVVLHEHGIRRGDVVAWLRPANGW